MSTRFIQLTILLSGFLFLFNAELKSEQYIISHRFGPVLQPQKFNEYQYYSKPTYFSENKRKKWSQRKKRRFGYLRNKTKQKQQNIFLVNNATPKAISIISSASKKQNNNSYINDMNVIDGNPATQWISRKSNNAHWLEINFGKKRLISKMIIRLGHYNGKRTIKKYSIQFYYQNEWFNFVKKDLQKSDSYSQMIHNLGGVDASKVRIYIPKNGTWNKIAAISEIEFYLGQSRILFLDPRLSGFTFPIPNGYLPRNKYHYPNAPRKYRNGIHAGLDIYYFRQAKRVKAVNKKTPILAAKQGIIIRSDLTYKPMSRKEFKNALKYLKKNKRTFVMRSFGGRQVWIDHGNGIVTCYNHMDHIHNHIQPGYQVQQGEEIGYTGNSGLWGEQQNNNRGIHLHFEIWVDGEFLGKGLPFTFVKQLYQRLFFQNNGQQYYDLVYMEKP